MAVSVVMPALELAQETGKVLVWIKKEGEKVAVPEGVVGAVNRRPYFHVFFHQPLLFQRPIEPGPADLAHPTHSLDTQAALHWHQLPDSVVDAFALPLLFRPARASARYQSTGPIRHGTNSW
jgi:hypothetical protein